ncbi:antibiotic biosynthesis monooxygenase family protein [Zooshikella harenae]|uniref:Antibiotic biosynthesis monooxygenase n=1 Tax=Zooshikella harenae TaxID=2827238 RepID=A0ABS5ZA96_9GAMM|nr:antibiotic biosynthesis monooxygenase family protein [Zooshikella harenae]MBU2709827.1 antibiotic biosynthesis monooxygenase [Zooshikella harenae]
MIKVIVSRQLSEGVEPNYELLLKEALQTVVVSPGFISAESLVDVNDANHRLLISHWTDVQSWQKWLYSEARQKLVGQIRPMLCFEEEVRIYIHSARHLGLTSITPHR